MPTKKSDIAVYGLGVMGSGLVKNLLSRGYRVSAYSKSGDERDLCRASCENALVCDTPADMLKSLKPPRVVFLMVTAGAPVDMVIDELTPLVDAGDVVIDGGNSHFSDTGRRAERLDALGIHYLGAGVSGGEEGAIKGPSMMIGGSPEGWAVCGGILQAMAAKFDGRPCCDYLGPKGAGHYVKMVHNGIEYAILQLIADIYAVMREGLGFPHARILSAFKSWRGGWLESYLIEITGDVLSVMDDDGVPLVEKILDVAGQKGTGKWTIIEAAELGVPIPTIAESVSIRCFSAKRKLRAKGRERFTATVSPLKIENPEKMLQDALLAGMVSSYAQGIELIQAASAEYGWDVDMHKAIELWQSGCIIRSGLLPEIAEAVGENAVHVIVSDKLSFITELEPSLRKTVTGAMQAGMAIPTLASVLSWYDCCRKERLPVNIVQALRDCFGAHTYRRVDRPGDFHTCWQPERPRCKDDGGV